MAELPTEQEIIETLGIGPARMLKANGPSKICGMLTAKGRVVEWRDALEHIQEHFRYGSATTKVVHSRFTRKLRDPEKLKEYIKIAASKPSSKVLSRMTIVGQPTGDPCLLILRDFKESIGEEPGQTWLVVVADRNARLVTAYPDDEATLRRKGLLG